MKLKHPFTCLCSGPTGSGKTSLIADILDKELIFSKPHYVLWLYAEDQPLYKKMPGVNFHQGIPDNLEDFFKTGKRNLLILDDLMLQATSDPRITKLFSVNRSHKSLSTICIVHNLSTSYSHYLDF